MGRRHGRLRRMGADKGGACVFSSANSKLVTVQRSESGLLACSLARLVCKPNARGIREWGRRGRIYDVGCEESGEERRMWKRAGNERGVV